MQILPAIDLLGGKPTTALDAISPGTHGDVTRMLRDNLKAEEKAVALRAVQGLQLQSIMHSDTRRACLINNTLYSEGQQVDSLVIEKIQPKSVIVKSGPYRFGVRIQN